MEVSRFLARENATHGTVITAGFQKAGRGRVRGRHWKMENGIDLAFTVLLRFTVIPSGLTLRTGLAAALAIEEFAPALAGKVLIKWPNDILLPVLSSDGKQTALKTAGILTESESGNVYIGIGVNLSQNQFQNSKSTSIGLAAGVEYKTSDKFILLEKILSCLSAEIDSSDWRERIETRLYKKGERVCFAKGAADSGDMVSGTINGIGPDGELLIIPDGETGLLAFTAGEIYSILPSC
jgi:BirA family biotin operon repressor/biotin-[acetyl-CoA-carboxylase] ligase